MSSTDDEPNSGGEQPLHAFIEEHLANLKRIKILPKSRYVYHVGFNQLYVRMGPRRVEGLSMFPVITLARIEVEKPGIGTFTRLVLWLQSVYPQLGIYVEAVQNPRFAEYLLRIGFQHAHSGAEDAVNFFLPAQITPEVPA